ncbi:MAG TPA: isoleucine--tRNA ligase [Syntrophales bacterium]|nr:isoleucine--tRNA ligase [Syntrophales bacterium]HOU77656.1 isoleucine--tRNA ligase [Syntrophales bacterium]HPC32008.1 isoleucine--tRNA ligase [Syntrophales bacterium]HQG35020.1 isoleucine--tRNA ligase [Syntrophales bacterium]HQI36906.1 isoleucine--tRNA ligase [Syntrophales bacterium]
MDYKESLNLPKTDFPMKANLAAREPEMLARWEEMKIYHRIRAVSKGREVYILHDGPPYANGSIHLGTALNKIIKDMVIKAKNMSGYDSIYVPGWDCHGLPIEHQVDKELGDKKYEISQADKRRFCRRYAERFVDIQREQFKRLGVFGEWENPYLTMTYDYEAITVAEFGKLYLGGDVYKGKKPVYWCATCKTALAEAEVEYGDHTTPSIYVKFPMISDIAAVRPKLAGEKVSVVIWTTTPWTIPANLAIAFHEEFLYVAVKIEGEVLILAKDLLDYCLDAFGWQGKPYEILDEFPGAVMEGLKTRHPLIDRESVLILAPFVTLDAGTGCVHIAPGHGQEDYEIGMKYGLDNYAPVDEDGRFTKDVADFAGMFVFDANDPVNKKLKEVGALLGLVDIEHSYPHCWRCKEPIIFRSTEQWFISMEKNGLRKKALEAIAKGEWIPAWGKDRIYGMVENRPDWCISRQRLWGVPITMFYCQECQSEFLTKEILDHVVALVREYGADVWFEREAADLVPPGTVCPVCKQGREFRKETNILDVWFDSGVSHAAVLETRPDHRNPSDMYLEGSDQHRGWFHSSLLECVGTRGHAPYKTVLTHGFVVDGEGKKMSKSVGNVVEPDEIINEYGAEILRLWVAAEDYTDDIRISKEILTRLVEAYRRIRNTSRYILGNLFDFDPARDRLAYAELEEMDRWALHRLQEIVRRVREAYDKYQFHIVYYTLYNFCTVDLSALYLDVLKDRLYTSKAASRPRRSAQTAMEIILETMMRLLAPILTFTAEEVWNAMPGYAGKAESVHLTEFPAVNPAYVNEELGEKWRTLVAVKGEISKAIEAARKNKVVGHSLDAAVAVAPPEKLRELIASHREDLKALQIVSQLDVVTREELAADAYESKEIEGLYVGVAKARGQKCQRCWIYSEDLGKDPEHPAICGRCLTNLK